MLTKSPSFWSRAGTARPQSLPANRPLLSGSTPKPGAPRPSHSSTLGAPSGRNPVHLVYPWLQYSDTFFSLSQPVKFSSLSLLFFFFHCPSALTVCSQNVCNCCVSMSWHPLLTWFMTFCLSCATCSLSMLAVDASSEFCAFKVFTFSSSRAIRSSFLFRHLEAAMRFLMRFLSALIRS